MACCGALNDDLDDDQTRISTDISHESEGTDESRSLITDYKNVTPLFYNIERENWEGVLMFLSTGKWSSSMFSSSSEHLRSPSPEIQAKTWVTSYGRKGQPEWSQLPIHAAVSYLAPYVVIQKIIQLYPKGARCTDNEGMLPVHLAFGFGAPDSVIALLLEPFPAAIQEKGRNGRYPYECCDLGPNKARGDVHRIVTEQTAIRTRDKVEEELQQFSTDEVKNLGLKIPVFGDNFRMKDFVLELLRDRKELIQLKSRPSPTTGASSSSSSKNAKTARSSKSSTKSSKASTAPKTGSQGTSAPS